MPSTCSPRTSIGVEDYRCAIGKVCEVIERLMNAIDALFAVVDSQRIRKQDDGFAARQLFQSAHDEIERAERADRKYFLAKAVSAPSKSVGA